MKFTRYIAIAALAVLSLFGILAFGSGPPPTFDDNAAVASSKGSGLQLHKETQQTSTVKAVYSADFLLQLHKAWVRERVGAMPLDIYRSKLEAVTTPAGYRDKVFRPKITINARSYGFNGISHNHYARADV